MAFFKQKKRDDGDNPLHLAIIENKPIQDLLDKGFSLEEKNASGFTPIELADLLNREQYLKLFDLPKAQLIAIYSEKKSAFDTMTPEVFEEFFDVEYLDRLEFESIDILNKVAKKCQKRLEDKDYYAMNRWTRALYEKEVPKRENQRVAIKWINPFLNYGIFAATDIPELTYIGEYTGVVKKRDRRKNRYNNYAFRYVTGPKETPYMIDAQKKGNFTRFINHSDEPNLTSRWIISGGVTHIIFFSHQFIPKDTQLTYDYGEYYWRSRMSPTLL